MVTAWSVSSDDLTLGQEPSLHFQAGSIAPALPLWLPARSLSRLRPGVQPLMQWADPDFMFSSSSAPKDPGHSSNSLEVSGYHSHQNQFDLILISFWLHGVFTAAQRLL